MDIEMRAAAAAQPVTLALMGDVGWDITAQSVATALKAIPKGTPLTISINSYGGDALAGIAVHNMLARHEGPKRVVIEGIAASAASLIAMAGDEIIMPENAFMMIHEAWGGALGDSETMRQQADVLDKISGAYRRTYAARSGQTEEAVAALMAAETWFTAEDAVTNGFATEAAAPAEIRAFASLSPNRYANAPEALRRLVQAAKAAPVAETVFNPPAMVPVIAEEIGMTDTVAQAGGSSPAPSAAPLQAVAVQPISASLADLKGIASRNGLSAEFVVAQAEAGATREAALEAALEAVAQKSPQAYAPARVLRDEAETLRARVSSAFASTISGHVPSPEAREFAGIGFHGLAREILAAGGERNVHRLTGVDLTEKVLAFGTHTASDFAGVLANTLNKTVRDLYGAYPNTWSSWCDEVEVDDYKQITAASIGTVTELALFAEAGPIINGSIAEDAPETYQVSERGILLPVSKQMMINDETRALTRAAQNMGLAAYTALRRAVFGILTTNANMADGVALFASAAVPTGHANLATASALDTAAFRALRQLLQAQSGPARTGRAAASMPPVTNVALLVGPARETVAYELTTPLIVPTGVGNALPTAYRSSTEVVMDAFLAVGNNPFYMVRTEPGLRPVEIAYIRGQRAPQITSAERIDYTGMTFRCLFDFGAKAVTWRTAAANLGV